MTICVEECIACDRLWVHSVIIGDRAWKACHKHTDEIKDEELVDDLAREIYVEYLVQTKNKGKRQ